MHEIQLDTSEEYIINLCPRCNIEYSYIEMKRSGDRYYLYAVHYVKTGRKRAKKRCYLGPVSQYSHVEKLHRLMTLTNLRRQDYLLVAVKSVEKEIEIAKTRKTQDTARKLELITKLRELLDKLEKILSETQIWGASER